MHVGIHDDRDVLALSYEMAVVKADSSTFALSVGTVPPMLVVYQTETKYSLAEVTDLTVAAIPGYQAVPLAHVQRYMQTLWSTRSRTSGCDAEGARLSI